MCVCAACAQFRHVVLEIQRNQLMSWQQKPAHCKDFSVDFIRFAMSSCLLFYCTRTKLHILLAIFLSLLSYFNKRKKEKKNNRGNEGEQWHQGSRCYHISQNYWLANKPKKKGDKTLNTIWLCLLIISAPFPTFKSDSWWFLIRLLAALFVCRPKNYAKFKRKTNN